jgi:hypothetical protein
LFDLLDELIDYAINRYLNKWALLNRSLQNRAIPIVYFCCGLNGEMSQKDSIIHLGFLRLTAFVDCSREHSSGWGE